MVSNLNYLDRTVLVVEDSADTRLVLRLSLQQQGFQVITAENGQEAVEITKKKCPDLILMDLNMPVMDGLTATELIRGYKKQCEHVPIVAITAFDTYGIKDAALEAGCNAYLTKPINFDELDSVIRQSLFE